MILVDSSVWIDFLGHEVSEAGDQLESLIRPVNQVVTTGIVLQEVLQGIQNRRSFNLTRELLRGFPLLVPDEETHVRAARIVKTVRARRKKIGTIDALLAALAIQNRIPFFTLDTGFRLIGTHSDLEFFE